jgi:endonuclease III
MVRLRDWTAPNVHGVWRALKARYGDPRHGNKRNPLSELLFIICSIQTDERKYESAYRELRRRLPRFQDIAHARTDQIAEALHAGGLSGQKARVIKEVMRRIADRFGFPTLAPLKRRSDTECERFLDSLPGVGKKTARCVMMYSLDRDVFPVDTHCWRISRRMGWVRRTRPNGSCSPSDMDRLQSRLPRVLRSSLHVNMVSLGREVCTPTSPRCGVCPIARFCARIGLSGCQVSLGQVVVPISKIPSERRR